jgi:MSHA pilin protein MshD
MHISQQAFNYLPIPFRRKGGMPMQKGISLIELIMFMVIISIAVSGILLVMNNVASHSADTLVRKQALAVAESLLEEIELQSLTNGCVGTLGLNAVRTGATLVCDYNGYSTNAGILDFSTNLPVPGLGAYNINPPVSVVPTAGLGLIPAASAVLITVSVTGPGGTIELSGYRAGS